MECQQAAITLVVSLKTVSLYALYKSSLWKNVSYECLMITIIHLHTVNLEIFARVLFSHMRSFVKIKSSQNGKITLLATDIGQSYPSREIFWSQVCLLTLFTKIKFSRKISGFTVPISKATTGMLQVYRIKIKMGRSVVQQNIQHDKG